MQTLPRPPGAPELPAALFGSRGSRADGLSDRFGSSRSFPDGMRDNQRARGAGGAGRTPAGLTAGGEGGLSAWPP